MKNELKNFTYVGPNGRQTYNYICLYEVRSTQTGIDHALSMLRNGKDVAILLDVNGANLEPISATFYFYRI